MEFNYIVKVDGQEIEVSGEMEVEQHCTCFSDRDVHPHMIDCEIDAACYTETGFDVMIDDRMRSKLIDAVEAKYYAEVGDIEETFDWDYNEDSLDPLY